MIQEYSLTTMEYFMEYFGGNSIQYGHVTMRFISATQRLPFGMLSAFNQSVINDPRIQFDY